MTNHRMFRVPVMFTMLVLLPSYAFAQKAPFRFTVLKLLLDYLYIYNFEPTRWPSGSPDASVCARAIPFGEIDSSPTKTFMMAHRNEHGVAHLAELSFGMRPAEELYDLKEDPGQVRNIAGVFENLRVQAPLREQLTEHLINTNDPRVTGGTVDWDYYPYYGEKKNRDWSVDEKP